MIGHRLNAQLIVYTPTDTPDGSGGMTRSFTEGEVIRAQVSQPSAEERTAAAQRGVDLAYVIHVAYDTDVERGCLVEHMVQPWAARVVSVVSNSRDTYKRLECEVVQRGL